MNYDFALVLVVIVALVTIGKPEVLREVTKLVKEVLGFFTQEKVASGYLLTFVVGLVFWFLYFLIMLFSR